MINLSFTTDFEEYFHSLPKAECLKPSQENMDLSCSNNQLINQLQKEVKLRNLLSYPRVFVI